jgi:DGQHR domain-containing protein
VPATKKLTRKRKPLSEEQLQKRDQRYFAQRIRTTFTSAGFIYLPTGGIEHTFGKKVGELDQVFIYENIILVCEETVLKEPREHLKNKKLLFDEIDSNPAELVTWLRDEFAERLVSVDEYNIPRYQIFFLYFSKQDLVLTDDDRELFSPVRVVRPSALGYFQKMAQNIRRSARTEILRYLGLANDDIGPADSAGSTKRIKASIIYPTDSTGFTNGVRVVSFMMSAEMLLRNSYVLRKDNWEETIELYQRLIEKERIQKIRKYLATKQTTFINNIIVSLPPGIEFKKANGDPLAIEQVAGFDGVTMHIPDEFNSICVIDGQHRIFAHYEGNDALEAEVSKLRKKFHLLVTGLIYPDSMPDLERRKFESELFLDINSNAKAVPQDVLLFIETLKDPFSDLGVARQVLERLNRRAPFLNDFQLSLMDDSKIKIASIIKFALRYLVDIADNTGRPSLFTTWSTKSDRDALIADRSAKKDRNRLEAYVEYCAKILGQYFSALRLAYKDEWDDPASKIKSTVSINGFIIALRRSLPHVGVKDFEGYRPLLAKTKFDFSRANFAYTSSQYAKLSREILIQAFELQPEETAEPEPVVEGELPVESE